MPQKSEKIEVGSNFHATTLLLIIPLCYINIVLWFQFLTVNIEIYNEIIVSLIDLSLY